MSTARPCLECGRPYHPLRKLLCHACYMRRRNRVGYRSTYVDAAPVRAHINRMLRDGANVHRIAVSAGLPDAAIHYILRGRRGGPGPAQRVSEKTARAVLAVKPDRAVDR